MGIFSFIFGKPKKVVDEFFGEMTFVEFKKDPSKNYFECSRLFAPIQSGIQIGIDAGIEGPGAGQTEFFKTIELRYAELTNTIIPLIEDEFQNWKDGFKIMDFHKEFTPVYIHIPAINGGPVTWEIVFESSHDENHNFSITMRDLQATEILIDG